jgi:hypothetical protein
LVARGECERVKAPVDGPSEMRRLLKERWPVNMVPWESGADAASEVSL